MHRLEDLLSRGLPGAALALLKRSRVLTRGAWAALDGYQALRGSPPSAVRQLAGMEAAPPPGDGPRVLVFSVRGWTAHLAWETTISRALHTRGAATHTVLCDRALPACEPRIITNDFESTCDRCTRQSGAFLERTGLPWSWLSAYLEPDAAADAARAVAGLPLDELRDFEAGGVPVGRLVGPSVNRHLLRSDTDVTPAFVEAYRRFVAAGIVARAAGARLLDGIEPDAILMLNGLFYAEAILLHMAGEAGIPVWTYERGKRVDSIMMARDRSVLRAGYEEEWARRGPTPLSPGQSAALDAYVQARLGGDVGIERLWGEQTEATPDHGAGPTAVLFTNVLWDTAVYDSDIAFDSMMDWVLHTVEWFRSRPDRRLVIRVHPAEVRVPFKRSRDPVVDRLVEAPVRLPPNVRVVGPEDTTSSYDLLQAANVVLAYTSTIGLEAALQRVPTVVAGRTHYRERGFTLDPADPAGYDRALDEAFAAGPLPDDRAALARRYAWLYFFEETLPLDMVRERPRSFVTFGYRANEEIGPGREPVLDAICDAILDGAPLTNPLAP